MTDEDQANPAASRGLRLSRRGLLGLAGVGAATAGATGIAVVAGRDDDGGAAGKAAAAVPFHGTHQAGIVTPVQDRLHFVSFDLATDRRDELVDLLRGLDRRCQADGRRPRRRAGGRGRGPGRRAARRHRRGDRAAALPAHRDDRLRPQPVPRPRRQGSLRAGQAVPRGVAAAAPHPRRRARPRPQRRRHRHPGMLRRSRRSPSTPSATWPAPPSAWPRCAGPSSASAAPPRPAARKPPRAT